MVVGDNTCDGKKEAYESLNDLVHNLYVMDLPQVKSEQARTLLKAEYDRFRAAFERLTGVPVTAGSLRQEIRMIRNLSVPCVPRFSPAKQDEIVA